MSVRQTHAIATVVGTVAMAATLVSGCGAVSSLTNNGVSNPITPEQSKGQVIDAAKEIVGILDLQVVRSVFWHASCNDQGDAPFRGQMMIGYPLPSNAQAANAAVAQLVQRLQSQGWTTDSDFKSHGATLKKSGVVAVLGARPLDSKGTLELSGECRDVTTTKDTKGTTEVVNL